MEQILERIRILLRNPKEAWEVIRDEEVTATEIIRGYLVYLAAIPAVSGFLGRAFVGYAGIREPVGRSFLAAIFTYLLTLLGVWILALVVDWLAPNFGGTKNALNATKLAVYAVTPYLIGGIFLLIPSISVLHLVASLYGIYLIYLGLPVLMAAPQERAAAYTVASVLVAIGVWVLALIVLNIFGLASSATRPW